LCQSEIQICHYLLQVVSATDVTAQSGTLSSPVIGSRVKADFVGAG